MIKFYRHKHLQLSRLPHAIEKPDLSKRLLTPAIYAHNKTMKPATYSTILLTLILSVSCSEQPTLQRANTQTSQPTARQMQMWNRSCALCHIDGNAGAPRIGHADEWQSVLDQKPADVLSRVISGYNDMPPLGYCMACEEADFQALIDMMLISGDKP